METGAHGIWAIVATESWPDFLIQSEDQIGVIPAQGEIGVLPSELKYV